MKHILQPLTHPVHARIQIPGSKSISNRALLLAALASGVSEIITYKFLMIFVMPLKL